MWKYQRNGNTLFQCYCKYQFVNWQQQQLQLFVVMFIMFGIPSVSPPLPVPFPFFPVPFPRLVIAVIFGCENKFFENKFFNFSSLFFFRFTLPCLALTWLDLLLSSSDVRRVIICTCIMENLEKKIFFFLFNYLLV